MVKLEQYGFRNGNYKRIIVTWGWNDEAKQQADKAGIELWDFPEIMLKIAENVSSREHFTDDTLRTLQLLVKSLAEKANQQSC